MCVCVFGQLQHMCCSKTGVEVSDLSPACLCGSGKNFTGVHAASQRDTHTPLIKREVSDCGCLRELLFC